MKKSTSLFDRYISQPRPIWTTSIVSLALLLLPFMAAFLDGSLDQFLHQGQWRFILSAPTILIYIWIISPLMSRAGANVVTALRPLVDLDDQEFRQVVYAAERLNPGHELLAIAIGLILGIAAVLSTGIEPGFSWLTVYWLTTTCLMYAILAWTIFIAVSSTRVNAALHRLPLRIDILNPTPFETVGRQSLLLALVFIGGITLSLIFTYQVVQISSPEFWISNILLVVFTILIFFLSMRPTHLLLAAEKNRVLEPVTSRINQSCRELVRQLDQGGDPGDTPALVSALVAYEQRLQDARTWPYNITMLRTLFFSVFIPLVSVLARLAVDLLFP